MRVVSDMVIQGMEGFELLTARRHLEASDTGIARPTRAQSIEDADNEGRTLLHLAALKGDSHACRSLLSAGANAARPDLRGRFASALARSAGHFELAAALEGRIETPAEIAARAPLDLRELMGLIGDNQKVVHGVIDSKRLNARDAKGDTPLHIVAMRGKMKVADLLVRSGADLHAMNLQGMTPAEVAASNGHAMLAALLAAASGIAVSKEVTALEPLADAPLPNVAPKPIAVDASFDLPDTLAFEALVDPLDFHADSPSPEIRGDFERLHRDIHVQSGGDEAHLDLDIGRVGGEVEGEGIDAVGRPELSQEHARASSGLRRAAQPSTWARFQIDGAACAAIIERVVSAGHLVEGDLDDILDLCHGRFDPTDLRMNILREIEAAGFELLGNAEDRFWDAPTDVEAEDLVGAIVATCTRALVLPGATDQVPRQKALSRLIDALVNARRTMLLDLVESPRAVDIILYMADRVLAGEVASVVITAHDFEPGQNSDESRQFIGCVEVLRDLRDDISAGSG
ncbi:MAG: ankyrin repeat domain-containing protein, partial [Cypionkella sp.]|nr:ankyrin repeat domain-containing protein [Cypionkella sp.]